VNIVVDVSGIAQILFQTPKKEKFETVLNNASIIVTPDLYVPELSNTLWKFCTKGIYTQIECAQFIQTGLSYVDEYIDSKNIWREALEASAQNKHPVYDMFYVVLARKNNGILVTNDRDLTKICEKMGVQYCY
jgi:predicted nucleic acid-binding protein